MKKVLLTGVAVLVLAGSTAVYAQHRGYDAPWRHHQSRTNPDDRAAFIDARIAAIKAGLRLTPDQDKLWPPLEAAVRDYAKLRTDRANARMQSRSNDVRAEPRRDGALQNDRDAGPIARLRDRAERMGETAAALKRIAESADPIYVTLDDGQKRRLATLTRMAGHIGGGWRQRGMDRGWDDDGNRGFGRDRGQSGERDRDRDRDRESGRNRDYKRDRTAEPDRL